MFWCVLPELDLCLGLIAVIVYGLYSLRNTNVYLADVYFFCRCWPLLLLAGYIADGSLTSVTDVTFSSALGALGERQIDILLCLLTCAILYSFQRSASFESILLLMLAYVGQLFMLHSCDLVSFYVCLEAQNFCFLVLCGLQPDGAQVGQGMRVGSGGFTVEAALKFLLLSAFSSGVLLFWFSTLYLRTGMSVLFFRHASVEFGMQMESFQILLALMFKLGAAPLHMWMVQIYAGVKRPLLMYISTAPKLSLFGFWVSSWHMVWTDFSVALFIIFSMVLGSFGAYAQPALRTLFAYSTVNEIGLMLMAIETAGFHSLFQHLFIYIITQLLLWNLSDKRLFSLIAVSLAGLPPLAGFFGKAWIFWHVAQQQLIFLLLLSLFCTGVSLVYYLRVLRLFWTHPTGQTIREVQGSPRRAIALGSATVTSGRLSDHNPVLMDARISLTSACVMALIFLPLFLIKPFVL